MKPPNLIIVHDKKQIGGHLGVYWDSPYNTIILAPGADWEVLKHEEGHHYYGSLGEKVK